LNFMVTTIDTMNGTHLTDSARLCKLMSTTVYNSSISAGYSLTCKSCLHQTETCTFLSKCTLTHCTANCLFFFCVFFSWDLYVFIIFREFLDIQYIFILSVLVALLWAGRNSILFFLCMQIHKKMTIN